MSSLVIKWSAKGNPFISFHCTSKLPKCTTLLLLNYQKPVCIVSTGKIQVSEISHSHTILKVTATN